MRFEAVPATQMSQQKTDSGKELQKLTSTLHGSISSKPIQKSYLAINRHRTVEGQSHHRQWLLGTEKAENKTTRTKICIASSKNSVLQPVDVNNWIAV